MPKTTREIVLTKNRIVLRDQVDTIYEKTVTPFGTSAKADAPRKHIGKRAYIIILKK
jgi:putative transposon-encoded protein